MTIDFSQAGEVSTTGLFALYSLDLIFSGREPPETAGGCSALRQMAQYFKLKQSTSVLRFEHVSPSVQALLSEAGMHW